MAADTFLRRLEDDALYLPEIKLHSLEKIQRHNYYASVFAAAMRKKWPQLAYVGLYSGAGRARVKPNGEIIETTAMSVLRLPSPFTHYIFVDSDERCVEALRQRVTAVPDRSVRVIHGDVSATATQVRQALPSFGPGRGLLSFCFIDPFSTDFKFDVIRQLGDLRMDFLILLMLGWDARVNFSRYYGDAESHRIADLIDCPTWREEWRTSGSTDVVGFLLRKFNEAMVRLGYLPAPESSLHRVTAAGKNVFQYVLAFYSKHQLGQNFWKDTLAGNSEQIGLGL